MPTEFELEEINIESWPFSITGIAYGNGNFPLEVIYSNHNLIPSPSQLRSAWRSRQEGRGIPLLVIVIHNDKAFVCGPTGEDPPVYVKLDTTQIESVCKEALEQPSRQAALGSLRDSLGSLQEEGIPGLRNEGFLATHELNYGVPKRNDWNEALDKTRPIIRNTGNELLTSLGYGIERLDRVTNVLTVKGENKAVAILLTENETPESGSDRFPGMLSPISHAFTVAEEKKFAWVFVIHGRKIRIYPLNIDFAVGRRGRTETYLECHTGLIPDNRIAYLWLIFSADALADRGSLDSIIKDYCALKRPFNFVDNPIFLVITYRYKL